MPGTEEQFENNMTSAYIGFDPTADSLHIGNFSSNYDFNSSSTLRTQTLYFSWWSYWNGRRPFGQSKERNLLDLETLL